MKAIVWHGTNDVRCDTVDDPKIEQPRDAIVKVSSCAICGSDMHLFHGFVPKMKSGDILGHEFMGEVVDKGKEVTNLKIGDRVVVPFTMSCGECEQCKRGRFSVCERSNPNFEAAEKALGHPGAAAFGYSHLTGGIPGGQAEYVRVPYADVSPIKVPDGLTDEQVLFLGDIFPTGWQAIAQCDIRQSDTVAIWGAGPVGQFCVRSAVMLGAEQVICIDDVPERLKMAEEGGATVIDFSKENVEERLNVLTKRKGPDVCVDAVGMEAHTPNIALGAIERSKQAMMMENDRPHVIREMLRVCRPAGTVSIPGVYIGKADGIPLGMMMNKGLTIKTGQTDVVRWAGDLLRRIEEGQIDPSFVITHTVALEDGPEWYKKFWNKEDGCIKVVMKPGMTTSQIAAE